MAQTGLLLQREEISALSTDELEGIEAKISGLPEQNYARIKAESDNIIATRELCRKLGIDYSNPGPRGNMTADYAAMLIVMDGYSFPL